MSRSSALIALFAATLLSTTALAREDIGDYSIKEALSHPRANEVLGNQVKFYFGNQRHRKVSQRFGIASTNKKTNAFNKTDKGACQWAFLSAMKALRDRALSQGGNAVINIKSNYRGKESVSNTTFRCGAGAVIAGVALKGEVVKLAK